MADFNVKVRFDDTGISTSAATATPTLKKRGTELYIVAPTGFLRATDKVRFARYHSGRYRAEVHIPNAGWLRPMLHGNDIVPVQLEYIQYMSNAYTEYWRVSVNLQLQDNNGETIPQSEVARMLYWLETSGFPRTTVKEQTVKVEYKSSLIYLSGKKLGLYIERNGVQITEYMPFSIDLVVYKHSYFDNGTAIPVVTQAVLSNLSHWSQSIRKLRNDQRYWIEDSAI